MLQKISDVSGWIAAWAPIHAMLGFNGRMNRSAWFIAVGAQIALLILLFTYSGIGLDLKPGRPEDIPGWFFLAAFMLTYAGIAINVKRLKDCDWSNWPIFTLLFLAMLPALLSPIIKTFSTLRESSPDFAKATAEWFLFLQSVYLASLILGLITSILAFYFAAVKAGTAGDNRHGAQPAGSGPSLSYTLPPRHRNVSHTFGRIYGRVILYSACAAILAREIFGAWQDPSNSMSVTMAVIYGGAVALSVFYILRTAKVLHQMTGSVAQLFTHGYFYGFIISAIVGAACSYILISNIGVYSSFISLLLSGAGAEVSIKSEGLDYLLFATTFLLILFLAINRTGHLLSALLGPKQYIY